MPKRLRELSPRHHAAIRMRIAGATNTEIERKVGVQRRTLYVWFGDPLVKAEIDRQLQRINTLIAEKLASGALVALDVAREILERPMEGPITPELRLAAIRSKPWGCGSRRCRRRTLLASAATAGVGFVATTQRR